MGPSQRRKRENYPNSQASVKSGADILGTGIYTVFNQPDSLSDACLRFEKAMGEGQ